MVVAMVILMEQEKSFQNIENVLHRRIIHFGKSQLTFVIENKQEYNLNQRQK